MVSSGEVFEEAPLSMSRPRVTPFHKDLVSKVPSVKTTDHIKHKTFDHHRKNSTQEKQKTTHNPTRSYILLNV